VVFSEQQRDGELSDRFRTESAMGVVGILGMGLVGSALAALAQHAGLAWMSVDGRASQIRSVDLWGTHVDLMSHHARDPEIVFVATKSFALESAMQKWMPTLRSGTIVVVLCNGLVDEELDRLQKDFPHFLLRRGMVSFGVKEVAAGRVSCVGATGHCVWGPVEGDDRTCPRAIEKIVIGECKRLYWNERAHLRVRIKWMLNTSLNCVLAAHEDSKINGDLMRHQQLAETVLNECWGYGCEHWDMERWSFAKVRAALWELVEDTYHNENSILRDLRTGRRTEWVHLCGVVDDEAKFPNLVALGRKIDARESR